jgi:hypothetical protein
VFDRWLAGLGALKPDGTLQLSSQDVSTSASSVNAPTTGWVHDDSQSPAAVKLLSFSTPIASMTDAGVFATGYCGESVFSDIHPGGGGSGSSAPVPASCSGTAVAPQDLALEFLFFDEVGCARGTRPPFPPGLPRDN